MKGFIRNEVVIKFELMLVSVSSERVDGRVDYRCDDGIGRMQSPASCSISPISPSPPPPPPPISSRWSDVGSFRRNAHCRLPDATSAISYSESDSCPQCRERYATFKRTNSIQSAATLNSYTGSSQPRKGKFKLLLAFFLKVIT